MFFDARHQEIYRALLELLNGNEPIDVVSVSAKLRDRAKTVGGIAYLGELAAFTPTIESVGHYARIVREKFGRRELAKAAARIAEKAANDPGDFDELLGFAEEQVFKVSRMGGSAPVYLGEVLISRWHELHSTRGDRRVTGVPTGFRSLDVALGGLQAGDLIVLAGRPGMGKTSLALQIAMGAAASGRNALVFSLEMGVKQIAERLVCMTAGLDSQAVRARALTESEWDAGWHTASKLAGLPIWVDDQVRTTTLDMRARARRLALEKGLGVVVVDYLQLAGDPVEKGRSRNEHIGAVTERLKGMARELSVPVVAVSQLSRAVEQRSEKIPQLSDLRDSGEIEQTADVVMFVYRPDYYDLDDRPGEVDVIIAKHRNGPVGKVTLAFQKRFARFADLQRTEKEWEPWWSG